MKASRAIFLSYASDDAAVARRIASALQSAGFEVWFDQSELRGGDAWDREIRRQIAACTLFVPVISAQSRSRVEGYFRLEWKLAVDRSHRMAAERPFLVPVVIDETPQGDARVPDRFGEVQWTRLVGGSVPEAFLERVARLLEATDGHAEVASSAAAPAGTPPRPLATNRSGPVRALGLGAVAVALVAVAWLGYVRLSAPRPVAAAPPSVAVAAPARSIAVLPFLDLSEKHDQQYLTDGLSEELIDLLARIPDLEVTARTSSFAFRDRAVTVVEIGRTLGVAHLLEGSVRKAGRRVRITAQLVRTTDGQHVWSESWDRDLKDVFEVQDDIARVVVGKLQATLGGHLPDAGARTTSPEAHNLYLQGEFAAQTDSADGIASALRDYRQAVALDANYAPAWAGIALALFRQGANGYRPNHEVLPESASATERAIQLDPTYALAYFGRAQIALAHHDWAALRTAYEKMLELNPRDAAGAWVRALYLQVTGTPDEAIAAIRESLERDPLNLLRRRYAARMYYHARRYAEAEASIRQLLALSPAFSAANYELGRILLARGDVAGARAAFDAESSPSWRDFGRPLVLHAEGREPEALRALEHLTSAPDGQQFQIAEASAYLGRSDEAFRWLDAAITDDIGIMWVRGDPLFDSIRDDPRFAALLRRLHLPEWHR